MSFTGNRAFISAAAGGGASLASGGTITGDLVVTGTLSSGAATLASAAVTGAATVGTTLGVTGNVSAARVLTGDGTLAAPAVAYTSEPGTGQYRAGAGQPVFVRLGASNISLEAAGISANVTASANASFILENGAGVIFRSKYATAKTSSATILAGEHDTTWNGTDLICTMTAAPVDGETHRMTNLNATVLTIARNAKNIDGAAADITLAQFKSVEFRYNLASTSWYTLKGA